MGKSKNNNPLLVEDTRWKFKGGPHKGRHIVDLIVCPSCKGACYVLSETCPVCKGEGTVEA